MYSQNKIDCLRFSLAIGNERYKSFISRMKILGYRIPQDNDPITRLNFILSAEIIQKIEPSYLKIIINFKESGAMEQGVKRVLQILRDKNISQRRSLFNFFK